MPTAAYRALRPDKIIETQRRLRERIVRRFPGSGLSEVAAELQAVAEEAAVRAADIRRPNVSLRIAIGVLLLGAVILLIIMARTLRVGADLSELNTLVQFVEAGLAASVLLGVAVLFLFTFELRLKRRRALAALHELRALAHVVDMHQLAKDPEGLLRRGPQTSAPPEQTTKTLFELNRYLNHCIGLLAIISKVAALYIQDFPDADAVDAVDQIEVLCAGLGQKMWQKLMVLEKMLDEPADAPHAGLTPARQPGAAQASDGTLHPGPGPGPHAP